MNSAYVSFQITKINVVYKSYPIDPERFPLCFMDKFLFKVPQCSFLLNSGEHFKRVNWKFYAMTTGFLVYSKFVFKTK